MTGRSLGFCMGRNFPFYQRRGLGPRWNRVFEYVRPVRGLYSPINPVNELEELKKEEVYLKQELENISKVIEELEK